LEQKTIARYQFLAEKMITHTRIMSFLAGKEMILGLSIWVEEVS
jgi:hypothetical protein